MSTLKSHEKVIFEKLFDRGGYVLNFSDRTFAEFFREHAIEIDSPKYHANGNSKMKRLRTFWEIEQDSVVGRVLEALLTYAAAIEPVQAESKRQAQEIISRLTGKERTNVQTGGSETDFLKQSFQKVNLTKLALDPSLQKVIEQRVSEIEKGLKAETALSVIFLCGSTLEGLLLDTASKNAESFNRAQASPRDKEGKVKQLPEWTLDNLINVAHETGFLSLDVKKFGHVLRDFRNYIHPRQQAVQRFEPDSHTAKICWQVLQAATSDLCKQRKS